MPSGKSQPKYRLTRYSIPWLIGMALLVPYEIWASVRGVDGAPLTHVVKWAYGEPGSVRWWLLGWATTGFILWMAPHFLFEGWGLKSLLILVGCGLAFGAGGILLTR